MIDEQSLISRNWSKIHGKASVSLEAGLELTDRMVVSYLLQRISQDNNMTQEHSETMINGRKAHPYHYFISKMIKSRSL